jgi:hypothetical protein
MRQEMKAMVYNSQDTARTPGGLAHAVTTFFESIGLLNKGSADASAVPTAAEAAQVQPIVSNSLNVTRVGGLAALVSSVGAVALAIFNVNKKTDPAIVVMAAYLGAGAIVVAALLAAAVIISADVRARTAVAVAQSPTPQTPTASPPAAVTQNHQLSVGPPPGGMPSVPLVLTTGTPATGTTAPILQPSAAPSAAPPAPASAVSPAHPAAPAVPWVPDDMASGMQQPWALYAIDNWDWPTARLLTATLDLWKVPYDHRDHRLAVQASFIPLIDSLVKNFSLPAPVRLPS